MHLGKRQRHTRQRIGSTADQIQRSGKLRSGPAMAPWPLTWILGPPAASASSADASGASSASSPHTAAGQQGSPASTTTVTKHVKGPGGKTDPASEAGTEAQTALASWAALLEPFKAGSGRLPEKARTDPSIRQRLEAPVAHLWEYVPFFAKQGQSPRQPFSFTRDLAPRLTPAVLRTRSNAYVEQAPLSLERSSSTMSTVRPSRPGASNSPSSPPSCVKSLPTRTSRR